MNERRGATTTGPLVAVTFTQFTKYLAVALPQGCRTHPHWYPAFPMNGSLVLPCSLRDPRRLNLSHAKTLL
jgi:hypothetical protein